MKANIYLYILVMAVVTYLIRMLPLVLIRNEIKNRYIKSFLYYVPFVTLSVMVFPDILSATGSPISATIGFLFALVLAYFGKNLFVVSVGACISVFISEIILKFI